MATTPTRQHHSVQRKAPRTRTRRIKQCTQTGTEPQSPNRRKRNPQNQSGRDNVSVHDNAETGVTSNTHPGTNKKKEKQKQLRISAIQQRRFRKAEANRKVPPSTRKATSPRTPTGNFSGICESSLPEQKHPQPDNESKNFAASRPEIESRVIVLDGYRKHVPAGCRDEHVFDFAGDYRTGRQNPLLPRVPKLNFDWLCWISKAVSAGCRKNMFSVSLATIGQETKKGGRIICRLTQRVAVKFR